MITTMRVDRCFERDIRSHGFGQHRHEEREVVPDAGFAAGPRPEA